MELLLLFERLSAEMMWRDILENGELMKFGESTPDQSLVSSCHTLGSSIHTLPSLAEVNFIPVVEAASLCCYPPLRKISTHTHIFSFSS